MELQLAMEVWDSLGREYVMDPMTNSERKIIHKALSQIEGVESHSEGDDPNRYVVVTKV